MNESRKSSAQSQFPATKNPKNRSSSPYTACNSNLVHLHVSGLKPNILESSQAIFYSSQTSFLSKRSRSRLGKLCWKCWSPASQGDGTNDVSLRPGQGAGKGRGCCCGGGGNSETENLPEAAMDQDDTTIQYKVEFSYPFLEQSSWSIGIVKKQFLCIRVVLRPPDIWVGHIKLKEPLEDSQFFTEFDAEYKKAVLTIMKPTEVIWRTIGTPQADHNTVMSSLEADPDFYPASILLKEELSEDHFLFAIHTSGEYQFGIPPAWHMLIKVDGEQKPYTPIRFITAKQASNYANLATEDIKGTGQITFFIIKIWPEGKLTSKLNELPLHEPGVLEIGGIVGRFDTTWLFETDRLIIIAGGSGISPWISVIKYCAERMEDILVRQVVFVFSCNASSVDKMIWHETWENMATLDWFFYVPYATVKSEGEDNNTRFTIDSILADFDQIPEPPDASEPMIVKGMGCGPHGFTDTCIEIFNSLEIGEDNMMIFTG